MESTLKSIFVFAGILVSVPQAQATPEEVTCNFRELQVVDIRGYGCLLENVNISVKADDPLNISGRHSAGRGNSDVIIIEIRYSDLITIPAVFFSQFSNVEALQIALSGTFRLEAASFLFAGKLRDLRIAGNNIPKITGSPFIHTPELEYVFLVNNTIEEIEPTAFIGMEKLFHFSLAVNRLKQLSAAHFAPLRNLTKIYLLQNQLEVVGNDWFTENTLLTDIQLAFNRIQAIGPRFLDGLSNIKKLFLQNNLCVDRNFGMEEEISLEDVRLTLSSCFNNFLPPPIVGGNFTFDVHGNMTIFDTNGDAILRIVN
jgi:hypothetical protein